MFGDDRGKARVWPFCRPTVSMILRSCAVRYHAVYEGVIQPIADSWGIMQAMWR